MPPTNRRNVTEPEAIAQVSATINNVWALTPAEGTTDIITVPSGQTCRCLRLGMVGIVEAGLLGDADTLTAFVDNKHIKRVRGGKGADRDEINVMSLLKDPKELAKVVMLVDRAMPRIIVEPRVQLHFEDNDDGTTTAVPHDGREADVVYTDQIGLEDKMYIFNWAVGGTADATTFLEQSNDALAGVDDDRPVPRARKSTAGRPKRRA